MNKIKELLAGFATNAIASLKVWALQLVIEAEGAIPGGTGAEKRAYVVKRLDDMVRLPWFLEPFDGPAFGLLVDMACDKLNLLMGHEWDAAELTPEQTRKIAAVIDVPASAAAKAVGEVKGVNERIEALYKQYGIK